MKLLVCFVHIIVFKCLVLEKIPQSILSDIVTLTHGGRIQGHKLRSHENNIYYAFQQIPYGTPPVQNLRFKESTEAKTWRGVLDTTKNTKVCVQLSQDDSRENEDCLYLNVYTPINPKNTENSLPVYFFIHGGYFYKGDGTFESYGPQFLIDYGIILVIANYRLGAFGFLSTGDEIIPGNLGLKDQNLALQWVRKNIHLFGGDPKKVTIGGLSAGAGCIGHHVLSKRSAGLFRAAIQQSGSPINSKMFAMHPRYFAYELGHSINKNFGQKNSSDELLDVLLKASAKDIKKFSYNISIPENLRNAVGIVGNTVWNPVEEYQSDGFVKGRMHDNFRNGDFNRVSIMLGFNSEEELKFDLTELKSNAKYFDSNAAYLINGNLNITDKNRLLAGTKLKKVYTDKTFEDDFPAFVKFISDAKYTTGVCRQAELASKYTGVFLYQYSYDGVLGDVNITFPGLVGVGHAEENNYLFSNAFNKDMNSFPESDLKVQKLLLTLWTNFIKYLNPIHGMKDFTWPKVKDGNLIHQNISESLNLITNPRNYHRIALIYQEFAEDSQYTF